MSIAHSRSAIAIEADQHIGRAAIEGTGARRLAVASPSPPLAWT